MICVYKGVHGRDAEIWNVELPGGLILIKSTWFKLRCLELRLCLKVTLPFILGFPARRAPRELPLQNLGQDVGAHRILCRALLFIMPQSYPESPGAPGVLLGFGFKVKSRRPHM